MSEATTEQKKKRGNPNFLKGRNNNNNNSNPMEEKKEETPEATDIKSKELPADIFSDAMPKEEVLPLDGEVKEKLYASLPDEKMNGDTPTSSSGQEKPIESTDTSAASSATAIPAPTEDPILKQTQAQQTVDLMFRGYEKLHGLGRYIGKIDDNELANLHMQGKIDLNQSLPLGRKETTVGEFFKQYNEGIDENIAVSDEFKTAVREPLIRICIKRGWFLSDELYVGMVVAEDLTTKTSMLVGLKRSANLVLQACVALAKKNQGKSSESNSKSEEIHESLKDESGDEGWREPEGAN